MSGFMGIGGSSAKTDRANQLAATQADWSIFNTGMGLGLPAQAQGTSTLTGALQPVGEAQNYFSNLLNAGRTETAERSAPAINAELAGVDAQRAQAGQFGTNRAGGTLATQANAPAQSTSNIDNIINSNIVGGQQQGAQGLLSSAGVEAGIGNSFLANGLNLLGLSSHSADSILNNATASRPISMKAGSDAIGGLGSVISTIATKWPEIMAAFGMGA